MKKLLFMLAAGVIATPALAQPFAIDWYTIDGGGAQSVSGGGFTLSATIGQPDAGTLNAGVIQLNGGYWVGGGLFCDSIDFNNNGSIYDPEDMDAFLSVYSEGPCIPEMATCNDIDFNNDTSLYDPCDIDSFLLVYSEGPCTLCGTP